MTHGKERLRMTGGNGERCAGRALVAIVATVAGLTAARAADERILTLDEYRARMRAAWIGQMVGVQWGMPTEFKFNDVIIPEKDVPEWKSEMIDGAFGNDDLYVEMTFLKTLADYGLDASIRQAGIDFANSEYILWCANDAGRVNLRKGIAPPDSSHPAYNRCPNDIDYQIEADYAGIISPGCPQNAIALGRKFGRLMNFGDGVWAGQFVGAMYAEAFFSDDVNALLDAGLAAIPSESDYAQMVRNVRAWHRELPNDWQTCWERIRAAYSKAYNPALKDSNGGIDVRLNGAMIVLGMLYGGGDLDRSMVISMRGGYDSDCNPSSVGGVLMCAKGVKALEAKYVAALRTDRRFSFTEYDFTSLLAVCEKLARQVVTRSGGRIETDADGRERFVIPRVKPTPDAFVPSWKAPPAEGLTFTEAERAQLKFPLNLPAAADVDDPDPTVRVQKTLDVLFPGWKTSVNAPDMNPGYVETIHSTLGQVHGAVCTHPPKLGEPVVLTRTVGCVPDGEPTLHFEVANALHGDFRLKVKVNGMVMLSTLIRNPYAEDWRQHIQVFDMSLKPWIGQKAKIELVNEPNGWNCEAAYWREIKLTASNGSFGE